MAEARPKVVIVGAGFGGLEAAKRLGKADMEITLVDRQNHHVFQPLLYQVATAALAPGSIAVPIRSVVSKQKATRVLLGEVEEIDLEERNISLRDQGELPYDYLIVAAGAETNYFGNDRWAKHSHGLKDVRDALRIREQILLAFEAAEREPDPRLREQLLSFVVIGGGPTGVEMAGAISELGRTVLARDYRAITPDDVKVTLIEMADRVLLPFDEELSASAERQLGELGVKVLSGTKVTDVREGEVEIGDRAIPAACVVWATGVKPVPLARRLGVELGSGGRVRVDRFCALPDHPEVFVIGDMAEMTPEGEEGPLPGLAPVAIQEGRYVADQIRRDLTGKARTPFHYVDKGIMATIGRSRAVVQTGALKLRGLIAWLVWSVIHILYLIGYRNRVMVMLEWVWSYVTFKRGARLITAREPISLAIPHAAVPGSETAEEGQSREADASEPETARASAGS